VSPAHALTPIHDPRDSTPHEYADNLDRPNSCALCGAPADAEIHR
jgi:hypothetical protein